MADYCRKILQNQASRGVRPLPLEFRQIVTDTPAHVDNQGIVIGNIAVFDKPLLYREEANIHPARPSNTVYGHVVVELSGCDRILLRDLEEVQVCVESELKCGVCRVGGIAVAVLLQVGRESVDASCESTCPVPGELAFASGWTIVTCTYIRGKPSLYFSEHRAIVKPVRRYRSGPASPITPIAARCFSSRADTVSIRIPEGNLKLREPTQHNWIALRVLC